MPVGAGKRGLPLVVGAATIGIRGGALEPDPVVHEGIVPGARPVAIQGRRDQGQNFPVRNGGLTRKKTVEIDPADIGFDEDHRLLEGEGGQGAGGRGADAREGAEDRDLGGQLSLKIGDQSLGQTL